MVLQRYTPPTCTLVIMANGSPLSRWAGRPVLKDLRFELSFDAPQLPEEQRVTVWGDRTQLEALCDAVTTYVQDLLHQSPAQIESADLTKWGKLAFDSELTRAEEIPDPIRGEWPEVENRRSLGETNFTLHPAAAPAARPQADLNRTDSPKLRNAALVPPANALQMTNKIQSAATGIYLQPKGLLSHNLFLGSLATAESGPVVHLGVLQLFDLASALDEYTAEMVALPSLKRTGASGILSLLKDPPAWMNTAAVVLLTVGLTAAVGKFLEPKNPTPVQTATNTAPGSTSAPQSNAAKPQQLAIVPPPPPPSGASSPAPQQSPAQQKLPSLPPGAMATPNSLPAGSPSSIPTVPVPKTAPNATSQIEIPTDPIPATPAIPAKPSQTIPEIPPGSGSSAPPPLPFPRPTTSGTPNIDLRTRTPAPAQENANQQPAPAPSAPPGSPQAAPKPAPATPSAAPNPAIASAPRGAEPPPALPSVTLPDQPQADEATAPPAAASGASEAETSATPQPAEVARGTAPDTAKIIPQVEEARAYFQQRWTPQEGLTQPLEYTLSLNADGSIQQITPRGLTAGRFLDRTGMPLQNEPFVSPVGGAQPARIRVVLKPDGQVLTFMEPFKEGL